MSFQINTLDVFPCRSWVNYNAITGAINNDGNVSTITDSGVGIFQINLSPTQAAATYDCANHCTQTAATEYSNSQRIDCAIVTDQTTSNYKISTLNGDSGTMTDMEVNGGVIFL